MGNVVFYPSNSSHLMPSPKYLTSASARSVLALARCLCFKRSASKVFFVCFTGSSFLRPGLYSGYLLLATPKSKKNSIWHPFRHQVNSYHQEHIRDSKVADILASNIITLVAAYIAVGLRFLSRRTAKTEYKADDWLIVPAL